MCIRDRSLKVRAATIATIARTAMAMRSATLFADRMEFIGLGPRMLLVGGEEQLFYVLPIHQVLEKCLEIIGPSVAIIDVIGVFPHIAAQNRCSTMNQRIFTVRGFGDAELSVFHRQPAPARSELGRAGRGEIGFHLLDAAEI